MEKYAKHIRHLLELGQKLIRKHPKLIHETGAVNTKGDKSIGMDVKIEEAFLEYLKDEKLPVIVFSEEAGIVKLHSNPTHFISFDPLDGSTNYKIGEGFLPFGTLIAVFKGVKPKLKDVIAAGAIEYTRGVGWLYKNQQTMTLTGQPVLIKQDWQIEHATPIYLDIYYEKSYQLYAPLVTELSIRNTGSTIGNLTCVLSGVAAGMGHACIKAEEVGVVYALIKGAGGTVVDHDGNDFGEADFAPTKVQQLLGGAKNVVTFAVHHLAR